MAYYLGLDLGTSSIKALIVREDGTVLSCGQQEYPVQFPKAGWAQQNPEDWVSATKDALRQACKEAELSPNLISAVSFSGQMHGLVSTDDAGVVVHPAIIWMDQRSTSQQGELLEKANDLIAAHLLNEPMPGMLICSLLWLKEHDPSVYGTIRHVMTPKDYLRFRLTGTVTCEHSDASATLAYSFTDQNWSLDLLSRFGIDPALFPTIAESTDLVGTVSAKAAQEWGLAAGTKVYAGGGDAAMQLVGNGIVRPGTAVCNIGTASQFAAYATKPIPSPEYQVWRHAVPGAFYMQGGSLNGGSTLRWLRSSVLENTFTYSQLGEKADCVAPGSDGLVFLPYLAGERTPYLNPHARGVFFGLTMNHGAGAMARSVMEGVTLNLCLCGEKMKQTGITFEKLMASGGGADSPVWRQILADVFGVPVYLNTVSQEAGFGACLTAMVGDGLFPGLPAACKALVHTQDEPTNPISDHHALYQERLCLFRELYQSVCPLYEKIR